MQILQFNKQSAGGSIITLLTYPNGFDNRPSSPLFSFIPPPPHPLSPSLTRHLSIQLMHPIISALLLLLIYDVIRSGL